MSKTFYTVEEALSIMKCLSDDEEEAKIVILPPDNTGEVMDKKKTKMKIMTVYMSLWVRWKCTYQTPMMLKLRPKEKR